MRISDSKLRADRLVFYAQDVHLLEGELDGFLELSGAKCALLIDCEGHLVTRRGEAAAQSVDSLAALTAGSFAATRQMAKLLGEEHFNTLSHQGQRESIQISLIGERTLLAIVWDERTNLGLVRFYAQETSKRLADLFVEIAGRPPMPEGESGLASDYSEQAAAALDDLF
jgi:predicted regulator of Ras-like GTPase activity (Roadblock/LC7/MglB family)